MPAFVEAFIKYVCLITPIMQYCDLGCLSQAIDYKVDDWGSILGRNSIVLSTALLIFSGAHVGFISGRQFAGL